MFPALDTEALKVIQETAVKAAGVDVKNRVHVLPTLPDREQWLLIDKDGNNTLHAVSQPQRLHKLLSVQEVVAFARHANSVTVGLSSNPIVWIGDERIIVTLDDRRLFGDRAIYQFQPTDEWNLISSLPDAAEGFDQRRLLRVLRVDLAESFVRDEQRLILIQQVRKIRSQQQSAISQGGGSFDTSVASAGVNETEWPDTLELAVRVFNDPALTIRKTIRCAFEVEPMPPRFAICPLTSHLARALSETLELASETIRAELKDDSDIPVFLGQPE